MVEFPEHGGLLMRGHDSSSNTEVFNDGIDESKDGSVLRTKETSSKVIVTNDNSGEAVGFDKKAGTLESYLQAFVEPMMPNFTRAETDNDRGGIDLIRTFFPMPQFFLDFVAFVLGYEHSFVCHWEACGLAASDSLEVRCAKFTVDKRDDEHDSENHVDVTARSTVSSPRKRVALFEIDSTFRVHTDARLDVLFMIRPSRYIRNIPSLARIGNRLTLDPSLYRVTYLGRGPHENYPDRKASADVGVWKTTPVEMHVDDYIVPGENGNRTDCRWISFTDQNGSGVLIVGTNGGLLLNFSASLWSQAELRESLHTCDLERRENGKHCVYVNIDHALMGVGGDVSWNPCVYDQFRIKATQSYHYR